MKNQIKPLVSILVHTKNSERTMRNHLESIQSQTYPNIEIVVVDNNSTDNTIQIAKKYTTRIFSFGPERSAQRNLAAQKARGSYFLIPDSDMILDKNVISECIALVQKKPEIRAVVIPEKSVGTGFWAACKALERSFYIGVSWMEAARFFEKKTFFEMGGYNERNTGTEDYDLPQRIAMKYKKRSIGRTHSFIFHDEGKLLLIHLLKKKFYYAQNLDVYKKDNIIFYRKQANFPLRISLFFSSPQKLFKNPTLGVGMLYMKSCEFVIGGLGFLTALITNYKPNYRLFFLV